MLGDGVFEGLAVAGGAVEIDHHHRITGAGIGLRVPAIGPAVAERALRPAVDQEGDRIGLALFITDRLDDIAMNVFIVPALEAELLVLAGGQAIEHRIELGQVGSAVIEEGGFRFGLIEGRRAVEVVLQENHAARGFRVGAGVSIPGQRRHLAGFHINAEQDVLADVIGIDQQALAVLRPLHAGDRTIPVRGKFAGLAVFAHQHDAEAIGLKAGALHGQIGDGLAIGRNARRAVPGLVVSRVVGQGAAADRHGIDVEIGAPRLGLARFAGGEPDGLRIRRNGVIAFIAIGFGGDVAVIAIGQGDGIAARQRHIEQVIACAIGPGVPVADEDLVVDCAGGFVGLAVGLLLDSASDLAAFTFRENSETDNDALAVRRELIGLHVERQFRHLRGGGAGQIGLPHLIRAAFAAAGDEIDRAIRTELRIGSATFGNGQPDFRLGRLGQILQPDRVDALVLVHVGDADTEHGIATGRIELEAVDAIELDHVCIGQRGSVSHATERRQRDRTGQQRSSEFGFEEHGPTCRVCYELVPVKDLFGACVEHRGRNIAEF